LAAGSQRLPLVGGGVKNFCKGMGRDGFGAGSGMRAPGFALV
jgi:hypothetical protein